MCKRPATKALLTTGLVSAIALSGCRGKPDIAWSKQFYAPDRHWLVTTHGEAGGSFGGGYEATIVSLKQAEQDPIEVLGFDHLYPEQTFHSRWVGPRNLEISIDAEVNPKEVIFQAVKCGDVTISLITGKNEKQSENHRWDRHV